MQLNIEQLEAEIARITAELDADERPCRPGPDHDGETVTRPIFQVGDDPHVKTAKKVGESVELPEASTIRSERRALKDRRRELRRTLASARLELEAQEGTRDLAAIEADSKALQEAIDGMREQLKANAREADRAALLQEVEDMPEAKRAALRQVLGPAGISSNGKIGTPG